MSKKPDGYDDWSPQLKFDHHWREAVIEANRLRQKELYEKTKPASIESTTQNKEESD